MEKQTMLVRVVTRFWAFIRHWLQAWIELSLGTDLDRSLPFGDAWSTAFGWDTHWCDSTWSSWNETRLRCTGQSNGNQFHIVHGCFTYYVWLALSYKKTLPIAVVRCKYLTRHDEDQHDCSVCKRQQHEYWYKRKKKIKRWLMCCC